MKIEIYSTIAYLLATVVFAMVVLSRFKINKFWQTASSIPAIGLHAYLLHNYIDTATGQNLSIVNIFALTLWLITLCTILINIKKSFELIALMVLPITGLTTAIATLFPGELIIKTSQNLFGLSHILLAIAAFSLIGLGTSQALLLNLQSNLLKRSLTPYWMRYLPSLETMETWAYLILYLSFIVLTITCICGFCYLDNNTIIQHSLKLVVAITTWLLLLFLLLAKHKCGLSKQQLTYGTLATLCLFITSIAINHLRLLNG